MRFIKSSTLAKIKLLSCRSLFILSTKDNGYYEIQLWSHAFKHEAQYPKNAVLKYLGTQRFIKIISMDGDNKNSNNFIIPVYSVNIVQSKQSDSIEDIFKMRHWK